MKEKLAVLILNWNSAENTVSLYNQLKQHISLSTLDVFTLVIDNDSKTQDQENLKQHIKPEELIFTGKNLGYAGGNNVGIQKALSKGADYVVILNPDIKINSDFINPLVSKLRENSAIGAIGPRISFHNNPDVIYSDGGILDINNLYKTGHKNWKCNETDVDTNMREVDYVNGSAMIIPKASFAKVGVFREAFFLYFEESEWCLRLKKANLKVVVDPSIKVFHESSVKGKNYHFYMSRNRVWLAKLVGVDYKKTRNKYLISALKGVIKLKPFAWSKLKGVVCASVFAPKENKLSFSIK